VLISELVERGGMDHAVIRAVRDHAVCMVNPFRCKPLYKKASLAVLSDEANARHFSASSRRSSTNTSPGRASLRSARRPSTARHRPAAVRRRQQGPPRAEANDDYGGKGIVLGWTVDDVKWNEAIRTALQTPYVVHSA